MLTISKKKYSFHPHFSARGSAYLPELNIQQITNLRKIVIVFGHMFVIYSYSVILFTNVF